MSFTHCALSGEVAQHPVVSRKSGHIFERRVIEKVIEATGKCPFTGQDLKATDLVEVKGTTIAQPRPPQLAGLPQMMSVLQSEWDKAQLDAFNLKEQVEFARQELSHALYQHDAACRVIAKLTKERDEARRQLSELYNRSKAEESNGKAKMDMEESKEWLDRQLIALITQRAAELNAERKARKKKEGAFVGFASPEEVTKFKLLHQSALHTPAQPGILSLDVDIVSDKYIVTGGHDHEILLFDRTKKKVSVQSTFV